MNPGEEASKQRQECQRDFENEKDVQLCNIKLKQFTVTASVHIPLTSSLHIRYHHLLLSKVNPEGKSESWPRIQIHSYDT